jgi:hypothetical protein
MAGKFIELKDAAKQLGITPDRLLEMRDAGDVHGYRDGASWKFKTEEVERVAAELSAADNGDLSLSDSGSLSGDDFDSLLDVNVDLDSDSIGNGEGSSILISGEDEQAAVSGTSIGKDKPASNGNQESDSNLAPVDDADSAEQADEDDLGLDLDGDLQLAADGEDELDSDGEDALGVDDDLHFESDDSLSLSDDDEASVADTPAGDLASPSDSGLSLELEGEGGSVDSLELPEDSDMMSIEEGLDSSPEDSAQLQQDEEFILSPSDEMLGDESSDSGSQVIALDDSEAFEDSAELEEVSDAEAVSLVEETDLDEGGLESFDAAELTPSAMVTDETTLPEAPFSVWNVLSLLLVVLMLSVIGMLMTDVIRNMWTWNEGFAGAGGIANSIVSMLGMD